MKTTSANLRAAMEKIDSSDALATTALARTPEGNRCRPTSPLACQFCPLGAIYSVLNLDPITDYPDYYPTTLEVQALADAIRFLFPDTNPRWPDTAVVHRFNDGFGEVAPATHEQVMQAFRLAILLAENSQYASIMEKVSQDIDRLISRLK